MRLLAAVFAVVLLALPATAQMQPPGVPALVEQLERRLAPPAVADGAKAPAKLIGLFGPAAPAAADKNGTSAGTAGWMTFHMTTCGAAIHGTSQYMFAFTTSGASLVTQNEFALPVLAANCASGKSLLIYIEADGRTVTGIASYVF